MFYHVSFKFLRAKFSWKKRLHWISEITLFLSLIRYNSNFEKEFICFWIWHSRKVCFIFEVLNFKGFIRLWNLRLARRNNASSLDRCRLIRLHGHNKTLRVLFKVVPVGLEFLQGHVIFCGEFEN